MKVTSFYLVLFAKMLNVVFFFFFLEVIFYCENRTRNFGNGWLKDVLKRDT